MELTNLMLSQRSELCTTYSTIPGISAPMHCVNFGKMAPKSLSTAKLNTTQSFNVGCGLLHRGVRACFSRFLKPRKNQKSERC